MRRMNAVLLVMAVCVVSSLAGCVIAPYTTREDSSGWGGISQPREVVGIPGVYFVPGLQVDIFFYGGYWWSSRGGRWYHARNYHEPWKIVNPRYVPEPIYRIPNDYRDRYERERRIPYGQWKEQQGDKGKDRKLKN